MGKFQAGLNLFLPVYIEIRKRFFLISSTPCASKSFCLYMWYHILHTVWKWLAGTRGGGEGVQQPKNPELKPIKCLFYRIRNELQK